MPAHAPSSARLVSKVFFRDFAGVTRQATIAADAGDYLTRLGLSDAELPEDILVAGGWQRIAHLDTDTTPDVIVKNTVLGFARQAWPAVVRLSYCADSAEVGIWRHTNPPPTSLDTGFPTAADIQHAIRVLTAVGIARAERHGNVAACEADQEHFEAVAAALEDHVADMGAKTAAAA